MRALLVQPDYHTRFPPLGLLKISSWLKQDGYSTQLVVGEEDKVDEPDEVYVTSLYTYAWKPVHRAIGYYKKKFPQVKVSLGGIYATILPDHAAESEADEITTGIIPEAEALLPDYSLVPSWDGSIVFSSRGCIRRCDFCAVPIIEGPISHVRNSIRDMVVPDHKRVVLWDNNFLASPSKEQILDELEEFDKEIDFNQGLDARLLSDNLAERITRLNVPLLRLAYDSRRDRKSVKQALERLTSHGFNSRNVLIYTLFNFHDTPEDFFVRTRDVLSWGAVSYPMRYQPIDSLKKNSHVSENWTDEQLSGVASARRVLGYGGAFPPYKRLVEKMLNADSFDDAFELWPVDWRESSRKPRGDVEIDQVRHRTPRYVNSNRAIVDVYESENTKETEATGFIPRHDNYRRTVGRFWQFRLFT